MMKRLKERQAPKEAKLPYHRRRAQEERKREKRGKEL